MKGWRIQSLTLAFFVLMPGVACAAIEQIVFTTTAQSIALSAASTKITIEAQDGSGTAVNGNSVCIQITSSSATGEFSASEANWSSPVHALVLTLSKGQFRRNFYYRDASNGSFTLTAQAGPQPGSSCTGWTPGATWSATQAITVGTGGTAETTTATTTTATSTSTQTALIQPSATVSSYVLPPAADIFADGGDDRTVIVGADTTFRGRAYNRTQDIVDKVRFYWNFGDGTTAEGMSVLHHFQYPGKYAVILNIAEHIYAASDKIVVTAVPAQLLFYVNDDASVSIENQESRDVDISRWMIRSYSRVFTLSDDTVILAGETLRIAQSTLGFSVGPQTELLYPNGTKVVLAPPQLPSAAIPIQVVAPQPTTHSTSFKTVAPAYEKEESEEREEREVREETATSSLVAAAGSVSTGSYVWWLGAFAIALFACAAVYAVKRMQKDEWNILDDTS